MLFKKDICKCDEKLKKMLQMTLLLRNMTVYTRFNRFQHCAINEDERDKPMSRRGKRA